MTGPEDTAPRAPGGQTALRVTEFTDPVCPWAWGSEPAFRLLRHTLGERAAWRRVFGILFDEDDDPPPDAEAERRWYEGFVTDVAAHTRRRCGRTPAGCRFPRRVGAMTGSYSMALNVGASTAAAVTVPLARVFGGDWRVGLGAWALLAAVAVPPWLVLARDRAGTHHRAPDAESAAPGCSGARLRLTRSPTAWALALYFGLQATAAYVIIGWLPQLFRDAGLSAESAGLLFAVTSMLGIPLSFGLAAVAGRLRSGPGPSSRLMRTDVVSPVRPVARRVRPGRPRAAPRGRTSPREPREAGAPWPSGSRT